MVKRPYIKRVSILGGEPLADVNLQDVLNLVNKIRLLFGNTKTIWLYTGYTYEQCLNNLIRKTIISKCDILIDGRYIDEKRDVTLKWMGSRNQRVIDIQKSLKNDEVVLYERGCII